MALLPRHRREVLPIPWYLGCGICSKLTSHKPLPIMRVCQKMPSMAAETRVASRTGEARYLSVLARQ